MLANYFLNYQHICKMATASTSYPKDKIKILLLENISAAAANNFLKNDYTQVQRLGKALSEAELIAAIKDVQILGIRSKTTLPLQF